MISCFLFITQIQFLKILCLTVKINTKLKSVVEYTPDS
jgi:hypothetical protein